MGPFFRGGLIFTIILCSLGVGGQMDAQQPCVPPTASGFTPTLPPVPLAKQPDAKAVSSFIDTLTKNNAMFEVILGQSRILTLKEDVAPAKEPIFAVGNPQIIDIGEKLIGSRHIRIVGKRIGVTDLTITTKDGKTYSFEVHVIYNLDLMRARLKEVFPDASICLAQLGNKVIVEGQARDSAQVKNILKTLKAFPLPQAPVNGFFTSEPPRDPKLGAAAGGGQAGAGQSPGLEIVNLLRVPGPQQVLLKVRIAEMNRTALRQIGADFLAVDKETGTIIGTQIGGNTVAASATGLLEGTANLAASATTTAFGIFKESEFAIFLSALRKNSIVKILAEPNLVTMNGHPASFLAGGQFPVPTPQVGVSGVAPTVTVTFQPFGVMLNFVPTILDGDVIRLAVDPTVSELNFDNGVVLVSGGSKVPGLDVRTAHTVVELREGQTLAIAGLMQLTLQGSTNRIPLLGDLPVIGPMFSNTQDTRQEKELLVLVTPYLVDAMAHDQVGPSPGDEVNQPNDLEFYFLNRIEGRTGRDVRATTTYDDPMYILRHCMKIYDSHVVGPHGFCE
jgi:pilus assembly protein CpaC